MSELVPVASQHSMSNSSQTTYSTVQVKSHTRQLLEIASPALSANPWMTTTRGHCMLFVPMTSTRRQSTLDVHSSERWQGRARWNGQSLGVPITMNMIPITCISHDRNLHPDIHACFRADFPGS
eukprot:1938768-Rhodomonas_salina.1